MYFDEAHRYDKKDLKSQEFANNMWYKKDNKLFADLTNILGISKPTLEYNIISHKTYLYFDKLYSLSLFLEIPDSAGDEKYDKGDNTISKNEKSYL